MTSPQNGADPCRRCGRFFPPGTGRTRAAVLKEKGRRGWFCGDCSELLTVKPTDTLNAETNFFPDLREGEDPRPAMEVCNHCPVRVECLDYAVADPHTSGIWGGVLFTSRKGRVRR